MNKIFIYQGIAGLHCECGNSESLKAPVKDKYETFYCAWSERKPHGTSVGYCLKCGSELHEIGWRVAPAEKRAELLATFGASTDGR